MSKMHSRQEKACPHSKIKNLKVLVVGCGAIGRQVARQVALLGINTLALCDDDIIEEHNVVPQMFPVNAIGRPKVEFLAEELAMLCPKLKIDMFNQKWFPIVGKDFDVVFPCVDNIEVRGNLFEFYQEKCKAFIDVRIGGDDAMILTAAGNYDDKQWYKNTLFKKSEAVGDACAQPMTNYIANVASGLAINQFARLFSKRGLDPSGKIIQFSSLTDEISPLTTEVFSA